MEKKSHELEQAMQELKKTQNHLIQSEKLASLGQLTAGVAHEINNPINFVSGNINPLRRNFSELIDQLEKAPAGISGEELNSLIAETNQLLAGIEEGSRRTTEIVRGLRNFSRIGESEMKKASINEGIETTLLLLNNKLKHQSIRLIKNLGELPLISCFPGQLNQVFMNLLSNAADALGTGGTITITTSLEKQWVKISIKDSGKGMTEKVRQKIFDPFFTTKEVGQGTGLGLSISYGIVEKHHGKIDVITSPGEGAEFIILLPV